MVQNQVFIAVDFGAYKTSKLLLPFGFLVNFFLSSFFLFFSLSLLLFFLLSFLFSFLLFFLLTFSLSLSC